MLRLGARVTVEIDGPLPHDGPLIVVANHISAADPPLVAGWLTKLLGRRRAHSPYFTADRYWADEMSALQSAVLAGEIAAEGVALG
jgi:1-acyl-sn-glycerol-3-phosphate acyltransferase